MSRRIALVINGYARAGKDTVCAYVIAELQRQGWRGNSISAIDPIYKMLVDAGVPVDRRSPEGRGMLAEVKSALERRNWWATRLCASQVETWLMATSQRKKGGVCFAHMREVAAIREFSRQFQPDIEVKTLLVTNPRVEKVTSNHADADVDNTTYDLTIVNDGSLDDLRAKCIDFTQKLMEEKTV